MIEAASNIALLFLGIAVTALWISAVAESDGGCGGCLDCPLHNGCPWEMQDGGEDEDDG